MKKENTFAPTHPNVQKDIKNQSLVRLNVLKIQQKTMKKILKKKMRKYQIL